MVDDVDLTKYFYINATENADGTTSLIVGIEDLLALENAAEFTDKEITETSTVVVTYTAVLNKNAVVGTNGNKNDVYLEFDNNPNDNGEGGTTPPPEYPDDEPKSTKPTGTTPKSEVWTYTTEIIIEKDGDKEKEVENKIFPCYVYIKMIMDEESWHAVRNITGVTGFVGPGSRPTPLSDAEVEALCIETVPQVKVSFSVGDSVEIISGLFEGYRGTVHSISDDLKNVTVLENVVTLRSTLKEDQLPQLKALAKEIKAGL
jgi:transcriptional antiterminator NusG